MTLLSLGYERAQLMVADGKFVARIARPNSRAQCLLHTVGGWISM
jgi:hypothetical protein